MVRLSKLLSIPQSKICLSRFIVKNIVVHMFVIQPKLLIQSLNAIYTNESFNIPRVF